MKNDKQLLWQRKVLKEDTELTEILKQKIEINENKIIKGTIRNSMLYISRRERKTEE
ncbi:hypothetical protein [Sutcliffiella cohnii]|uniref:hypothetical protein n=1 Tax=Sutcliffiella cohnii TaxID=33932 RepID=UPI000A991F88|nr:hypothetical protein [Sutcliffiella cohnii]